MTCTEPLEVFAILSVIMRVMDLLFTAVPLENRLLKVFRLKRNKSRDVLQLVISCTKDVYPLCSLPDSVLEFSSVATH